MNLLLTVVISLVPEVSMTDLLLQLSIRRANHASQMSLFPAEFGAEGRPVRIFTADGILNFSGYGDCSHAVTPGVYIVKAGDTVVKIFVR